MLNIFVSFNKECYKEQGFCIIDVLVKEVSLSTFTIWNSEKSVLPVIFSSRFGYFNCIFLFVKFKIVFTCNFQINFF